MFIFVRVLEIIMGLLLLLGKIKPNALYGFRTVKTVSNDEIWYKVNKYFGRGFIVAGSIVIACSTFLLLYRSMFSVVEISLIGLFILTIPLVVAVAKSFIYLKNL